MRTIRYRMMIMMMNMNENMMMNENMKNEMMGVDENFTVLFDEGGRLINIFVHVDEIKHVG